MFLLLIQLLMLFFPFDYFLTPAYIFFIHGCFFKARVSLPEFRFPSFGSGPEKSMIFLLVALQVQQHEVLFGRVAALQCAVLFGRVAALQCAVLFAALKRTNLLFVISIRSRG